MQHELIALRCIASVRRSDVLDEPHETRYVVRELVVFRHVGRARVTIVSVRDHADPDVRHFAKQAFDRLLHGSPHLRETRVHASCCVKTENYFYVLGLLGLHLYRLIIALSSSIVASMSPTT